MNKIYIKWTLELAKETTIGFSDRVSWRKAHPKAYGWAWSNNVLEQILETLPKKQSKPKVIKEKVKRIQSAETRAKIGAANAIHAKKRGVNSNLVQRKPHIFVEGIESKECSKCKLVKSLDQFGKNKWHKWDGLTYECRACRSRVMKDNYKSNYHKYSKDYAINRRRGMKVKCVEYKGNKCKDCGIYHIDGLNTSIFQFHHRDPLEKDFAVSNINMRNFDNIKPELDKCDMLCANCHHIRHWKLNK
jgi:hypothetical protein